LSRKKSMRDKWVGLKNLGFVVARKYSYIAFADGLFHSRTTPFSSLPDERRKNLKINGYVSSILGRRPRASTA